MLLDEFPVRSDIFPGPDRVGLSFTGEDCMEFRKILALRGPNIWARLPVLEAWIDLGAPGTEALADVSAIYKRLRGCMPTLGERHDPRVPSSIAQLLERVVAELQTLSDVKVRFSTTVATSELNVFQVVVSFVDEVLALDCLHTARALCEAAAAGRSVDAGAEVRRLRSLNHEVRFGPSTGAIVAAAVKRGIPARRLNKDSLVQLGHGALARRISTAETSRTGAIAEAIAQDKELTRDLLHQVGVPVPAGRPVSSAEDAWEAAREIGGAVVIKPRYGNHGRGVTTNLTTRPQVIAAYEIANESTSDIMVEQFAPGDDYRLLVVGRKLVAAARREPAQVVGDGIQTIGQLVEEVNRDPRRGDGHATCLSKISIDQIARVTLLEQGYLLESIPDAGTRILIRRNANLSTGGTANDVTELVHPDVASRAIEAAMIIGLDIAGIDLVIEDISKSMEAQRGVVVEVNAGPGLRMHLEPSAGQRRPVGEAIIDSLFPPGDDGRVPIVAVTGVNGKTTVTRLVAHLMAAWGKTVGMTNTDGIHIADRRVEAGDCAGPKSAKAILLNPKVEAAVLETARGGILREGLGFDLCDVGIVTNIGYGDHLSLNGVNTLEQLARVKRTIIEAVAPWGSGVLKADDPLTAAMAPFCPGKVIFFAKDPNDAVLSAHRPAGGRAVFLRDGLITLAEGSVENTLTAIARVPLTLQGRIGFQIDNVLAATAAAWALEIDPETIIDALHTFGSDVKTTPGRFNVLHHGGATVIMDYVHNESALLAIGEAIEQLPHERRSAVFTVAGDRRDIDIIRQGQILADMFDDVVVYEDSCTRGRPDGEVVELLRKGIALGTRIRTVHETRGEFKAVEHALSNLRAGDLLIIQVDRVDAMIAFILGKLADSPALEWMEIERMVGSYEAMSVGSMD